MHILSKGTLRDYWAINRNSKGPLESWHKIVKTAAWDTPNDLIKMFPKASILQNNRAVFRLLGNEYRLIVIVDYRFKKVFIRFIGTHAEYDKIDANTV
jgi:mRNA interferase HigB